MMRLIDKDGNGYILNYQTTFKPLSDNVKMTVPGGWSTYVFAEGIIQSEDEAKNAIRLILIHNINAATAHRGEKESYVQTLTPSRHQVQLR